MNQKKILSNLDFYLLNTKNPEAWEIELVEKSFKFWQSSWEETFNTLQVHVDGKLHSDDFLERQAIALFSGPTPVGLLFCSWYSTQDSQLAHSCFKQYPKETIDQIKKFRTDKFMILSYMTCHPEWRKSNTDVPVSELLYSLGVKIFEESKTSHLVCCVRKNVGVHEICYRHGGIKISEDRAYNVDVEYIYLTQATKKPSSLPGVEKTANILWEKMKNRFNNVIKIAS